MDPESAKALFEAFQLFDADDTASVAVFWGEGGAFCAGWDLKHAASLAGAEALDPFEFPNEGAPPMAAMGPSRLELSKPVIAAVAGPAVAGGMELALWCDIRVMEETAFMGVYCRRWGIPLIDGGTVRLPRLVGEGRAMDLILTGRRVDADEALRTGLCEYVVPEGDARAKADAGLDGEQLEYLRTTIVCFLKAREPLLKKQLFPVLARVLKLDPADERAAALLDVVV